MSQSTKAQHEQAIELDQLEREIGHNDNEEVHAHESHKLHKSDSTVSLGKRLADAHDNQLSPSKIKIVLLGMSLSIALSFIDLNGLSIVMPYIADSINAQLTISWANTSQLIGMSLFQLLCGRFADIFGRKNFMVVSIVFMGIFELACGLSQTDVQFFIFRALCGVANGNISSLAMVVMSDIVPLSQRGTYQGYLSVSIGLGNAVAPFLASLFIQHSTWRKYFFTLFALSTSSSLIIYYLVPNSTPSAEVSLGVKLRNIDYAGFLFGGASIILLLVPVNGGGLQFEWTSAKVIVMLVVGGVCGIVFVLIETRLARLPMMPMKVFTQSISLCLVFVQCVLFGLAFYSVFFYYGYYFEIVRGFSPVITSCFFLCVIVPHYSFSTVAGRFVTWTGHYNPTIHTGFACWTLAFALLASVVHETTSLVGLAFIMLLNGFGQGLVFQNTLVAALAHSRQQDRAVVISTRQVLRYFGGCVGLALSSLIFSTSFTKYLNNDTFINTEDNAYLKQYLRENVYSKIDINGDEWSATQIHYIKSLYMRSLKQVYIWWTPLIGACLIISFLIKDRGLIAKEDQKLEKK